MSVAREPDRLAENAGMLTVGLFCLGLLAIGLLSRRLEARSLTPQIVLLTLGLVLGFVIRDQPELIADASILHEAGEVALILALFVDAARIDVGALRGSAGLPVRLLAIGLPLTVLLGAIIALAIFPELTIVEALLLAALVAPTDAALGAQVVNSPRVPLRIRQALNVESGLNDGLVTPLVVVTALVVAEGTTGGGGLADAVSQIVFGTVAGIVVGVGGALLLRVAVARSSILDEARWTAGPALALLAWALAVQLGGNAFVAAFVAGIAMTATYGRVPEAVLEFAARSGDLIGLIVFFLFGTIVAGIGGIGLPSVVFAVLALTVVRMLPVAVALIGTRLAPATIAFMGWFGPRGLASIVLALVALGDSAGEPGISPAIIGAVVLTVVFSVIAHGLTAGPGVAAYARAVDRLPDDAPDHEPAAAVLTRRAIARHATNDGAARPGA